MSSAFKRTQENKTSASEVKKLGYKGMTNKHTAACALYTLYRFQGNHWNHCEPSPWDNVPRTDAKPSLAGFNDRTKHKKYKVFSLFSQPKETEFGRQEETLRANKLFQVIKTLISALK